MADTLPFPDPNAPLPPPETPQPPKGAGVRRIVIASVACLLCLGLAALLLFGTRTAHRFGKRPVTTPVEAAPRPAQTGDPLKGLEADYASLLKKPPVAPVSPAVPSAQAALPTVTPAAKEPQPKTVARERGMLVLESKKRRDALQPQGGQALQTGEQGEAQTPSATPMEQNRAYLQQAEVLRDTRVQDQLHTPESPWMILAGDFLPAALVTGMNSGLPGELKAQVSRDVRDTVTGTTVLVPQGTVLIGTYNNEIVYGQDRVLVVWHRLRLPNGQSIQLQGMPGIDVSGFAGLKDRVDNHLWPLFRAVILSSVLSIGTRIPAGTPQGYWPTLGQEAAQDVANNINQAGQAIVRRELSRPPTISIRPGMSFSVFVLKDLVLAPYPGAVARRP
jgi:type IV secretion system protein VirB10